jgi:hypothetical protein
VTATGDGTCASNVGGSGADSYYGVFNAVSGLNWLTQVGYAAPNWGAAVGYRYGTQASSIRDGNGIAGASLASGQSSSSIAFNAYWQPIKTGWFPSISAGYGYNFVTNNSTVVGGDGIARSSASWFAGLQWDNAFIKGNAAGIALGQPSFSNTPAQSDPWLVEWFYRFKVSDNISITPTLFYASGISTTRSSSSGGGSGSASNGSTFAGLGDTVDGHRMRAQKFGDHFGIGVAAGELQALEEIRHRLGAKTGLAEQFNADAVGFFFVGAREIDLELLLGGRDAGDGANAGLWCDGSKQDGAKEGGHRRNAHIARRFNHPRAVALRDVRDFVRQHRGDFAVAFGTGEQP